MGKSKTDFDDFDLDIPDFDYGDGIDSTSVSKKDKSSKRSPVLSIGKNVVKGAAAEATDPRFLARGLKDALPEGYESVFTSVDTLTSESSALYDDTINKLKPKAQDIARRIDRLVPEESKILKSISKKFKDLTGAGDSGSGHGQSDSDREEQTIGNTLAEIFQKNNEREDELRARDSAEGKVKDKLREDRERAGLNLTGSMAKDIGAIRTYTDTITTGYYKKSLELQMRSFFVQSEMLKDQRQQGEEVRKLLDSIMTNTALPEYSKITMSERFKNQTKERFINGVFGEESAIKRLFSKIRGDVEQISEGVKMGLEMGSDALASIEDMEEINRTLAESGMEVDTWTDQFAQMAGAGLAGKGRDWLTNKIRNALKGTTFEERGWELYTKLQNPAAYADSWNAKDIPILEMFAKKMGMEEQFKNFKRYITSGLKEDSISRDLTPGKKITEVFQPAEFTNRTVRTIEEIIPALLSSIHYETYRTRVHLTGNNSPTEQMLTFDFSKGVLKTKSELTRDTKKYFEDRSKTSGALLHSQGMYKALSGDRKVSSSVEREITEMMAKHALTPNVSFEPEAIVASPAFAAMSPKAQEEVKAMLSTITGSGAAYGSISKIQQAGQRYRKDTEDYRSEIDLYNRLHSGEILDTIGLTEVNDKGQREINTGKILEDRVRSTMDLYDLHKARMDGAEYRSGQLGGDSHDGYLTLEASRYHGGQLGGDEPVAEPTSISSSQAKDYRGGLLGGGPVDPRSYVHHRRKSLSTSGESAGDVKRVQARNSEYLDYLFKEHGTLEDLLSEVGEDGFVTPEALEKIKTIDEFLRWMPARDHLESRHRKYWEDAKHRTANKHREIKSDINAKSGISKFNPMHALKSIRNTRIFNWKYKEGMGDDKAHVGPMAQDVQRNFGDEVAPDGTKIDMINMNGANMAAIQALDTRIEKMGKTAKHTDIFQAIRVNTYGMLLEMKNLRGINLNMAQAMRGFGASLKSGMGSLTGMANNGLESLREKFSNLSNSETMQQLRSAGSLEEIQAILANSELGQMSVTFGNKKVTVAEAVKSIGSGVFDLLGASYTRGKGILKDTWGFGRRSYIKGKRFVRKNILNAKNKERISDAADWVWETTVDGIKKAYNFAHDTITNTIPDFFKKAKNFGNDVLKGIVDEINGPDDVYTSSNPNTAVITAKRLKRGLYTDRATGKRLFNIQDVMTSEGDILDIRGRVVLTQEDIADGIFDKEGKPFRKVASKLGHFAAAAGIGAFKLLKNKAIQGFGGLKKLGEGSLDLVKGFGKKAGAFIDGKISKLMSGTGMYDERIYKVLVEMRGLMRGENPKRHEDTLGDLDGDNTTTASGASTESSTGDQGPVDTVSSQEAADAKTPNAKPVDQNNLANTSSLTGMGQAALTAGKAALGGLGGAVAGAKVGKGFKGKALGAFSGLLGGASKSLGGEDNSAEGAKAALEGLTNVFRGKISDSVNDDPSKAAFADMLGGLISYGVRSRANVVAGDKRAFNDRDGSGRRDGSWEDRADEMERKKIERESNRPENTPGDPRYMDGASPLDMMKKAGGFLAGAAGLLASGAELLGLGSAAEWLRRKSGKNSKGKNLPKGAKMSDALKGKGLDGKPRKGFFSGGGKWGKILGLGAGALTFLTPALSFASTGSEGSGGEDSEEENSWGDKLLDVLGIGLTGASLFGIGKGLFGKKEGVNAESIEDALSTVEPTNKRERKQYRKQAARAEMQRREIAAAKAAADSSVKAANAAAAKKVTGVAGLDKIINGIIASKNAKTAATAANIASKGRMAVLAARGLSAIRIGASLATTLGIISGSGTLSAIGIGLQGAAAVLGSSVLLPVAAIAAVAVGGYFLAKYLTKNKLNDYEKIRAIQYGFGRDSDESINHKLMALESYFIDGRLVKQSGRVDIAPDRARVEEIAELLGFDPSDMNQVDAFATWFGERFKPYFLGHMNVYHSVTNTLDLKAINSVDNEKKLAYLRKVSFPDGPSTKSTSPFPEIEFCNTSVAPADALIKKKIDEMISYTQKKNIGGNPARMMLRRKKEEEEKFAGKTEDEKRDLILAERDLEKEKAKSEQQKAEEDKKKREEEAKANAQAAEDRFRSAVDGNYTVKNHTVNGAIKYGGLFAEEGREPQKVSGKSLTTQNIGGSMAAQQAFEAIGPLSDGAAAMQYIRLGKNADLSGLNPQMRKQFFGMVEEYGQKTGNTIGVNSAYRSYQVQAALHKQNPGLAAPPGRSLHEFGLAMDIDSKDLNALDKLGLMRKYGFTRPVGGETWHMEPAGIQVNINRAKRDPKWASVAIEYGIGRGGAGYGTVPKNPKGGRNPDMAVALLDLKSGREPGKEYLTDHMPDVSSGPVIRNNHESGMMTVNFSQEYQSSKGNSLYDKYREQHGLAANEEFLETDSPKPQSTGGSPRFGDESLRNRYNAMQGAGPGKPVAYVPAANSPLYGQSMGKSANGGDLTFEPEVGIRLDGDIRKYYAPASKELKDAIISASRRAGVDPVMMQILAAIESSLDPSKKNTRSSAAGLYQFIDDTWNWMMKLHGKKYGLSLKNSKHEVFASVVLAAEYVKQNIKELSSVAPKPTVVEVYLAHFLGAGGARTFLSAPPNVKAGSLLPSAASSNPDIFGRPGSYKSVSQVYALIAEKIEKVAKAFNISGTIGKNLPKTEEGLTTNVVHEEASKNFTESIQPAVEKNVTTSTASKKTDTETENMFAPVNATYSSASTKPSAETQTKNTQVSFDTVNDTLARSLDVQQQMLAALKILVVNLDPKTFSGPLTNDYTRARSNGAPPQAPSQGIKGSEQLPKGSFDVKRSS